MEAGRNAGLKEHNMTNNDYNNNFKKWQSVFS